MPSLKKILVRGTPISVEREFALFHRSDCTPLFRKETDALIQNLTFALSRSKIRTEVVGEVAANSIEVKICFSNIARIISDLEEVYHIVAETLRASGVYIIGTSQPDSHAAAEGELTRFMTIDVFQAETRMFAPTNSIHMHFGVRDEEIGIALYNAGNRIAPLSLAFSQCSVIDGKPRGRAAFMYDLLSGFPPELAVPWVLQSFADFTNGLERARAAVEQVVRDMHRDYISILAERYPAFICPDGKVKTLSPDKIFHPARLRPDKSVPEMGLFGSVEFRTIDGQPTMGLDISQICMAIGLLAYYIEHGIIQPLSHEESTSVIPMFNSIASRGLGGVEWNGLFSANNAFLAAIEGLGHIGIEPDHIIHMPLDCGAAQFAELRDKTPEQIIRLNHERFMASALGAR